MSESESVPLDHEPDLPPQMAQLVLAIEADRKTLLREKAYTDPVQLRTFIGLHVLPRLLQVFKLSAGVASDAYALSVSNVTQGQRLHAFMVDELQRLGSDVRDDDPLPGFSTESLEAFRAAFWRLGMALQKHFPDNAEIETAFNEAAEAFGVLDAEVQGIGHYDDEEPEEEEPPPKPRKKLKKRAEAEAEEPEPEAEKAEEAEEAQSADDDDQES